MKRIVKIVEEDEYNAWLKKQTSYYEGTIKGTTDDPYTAEFASLSKEMQNALIGMRKSEFDEKVIAAMAATKAEDKIIRLDYVNFVSGGSTLEDISKYELSNVVDFMKKNPSAKLELAGHTDSQGDLKANMALSQSRAEAVYNFLVGKGVSRENLVAVGYGPNRPIDTNDTADGRKNNRRTELQIMGGNETEASTTESTETEVEAAAAE